MSYDTNIFATPNQGLAAFLITMGYKVSEASLRDSKFGGQSYFFVYGAYEKEVVEESGTRKEVIAGLSSEGGKQLATDFYEKKALVEPFAYYEAMKELRALIRDARSTDTATPTS